MREPGPARSSRSFRSAGAQELPFADNSFDAAIMALVISFVPDPVKAVAEMARVVRPGGMVATYMWDIPGGGLAGSSRSTRRCGRWALGCPLPPGCRGDAAGQHAGAVGEGRAAVGRDARHPHPCRIFRLRRFLGFKQRADRTRRARRSTICRRRCASSSRRSCASSCRRDRTGASPMRLSPTR